jgi:hypothetical protein
MDRSLNLALIYKKKRSLPSDLHTGNLGRRTIINHPPKRVRHARETAPAGKHTRRRTGTDGEDSDDGDDEDDGNDESDEDDEDDEDDGNEDDEDDEDDGSDEDDEDDGSGEDVEDVEEEEGQDLEVTQVDASIQETQREGLGHSAGEPQDTQNLLGHEQQAGLEVRHQLICPKITV